LASSIPRILITNDDGYDAPGLARLAAAMGEVGRVIVVAPDREQSASSHSLTLERPLRVRKVALDRYRVDGTPTDCVHLAVDALTGGRLPDLVVSGINRGLNIGDDVTYSGTVAGAIEGTLLHVPAIAFSAAEGEDEPTRLDAANAFAARLGREVLDRGLPRGVLLNVNFPAGTPRGVRVTRQGTRTYRATSLERLDPAGRPYYWIAGIDMTPTGEADGDHAAIAAGFISVSPLRTNMTDESALDRLGRWELGIG